jgi:hypothetical protein
MELLEVLLFFNPMPPNPDARMATLGLKISGEELKNSIKKELERHQTDGLVPGYWSEEQQLWFIDPSIWACIHNQLIKLGCVINNQNDPQWHLYQLGQSSKFLACKKHHFGTTIWHLLTTERNLKAWDRRLKDVEQSLPNESEENREKAVFWLRTEREALARQKAELEQLKSELFKLSSQEQALDDDSNSWIDNLEEFINELEKRSEK